MFQSIFISCKLRVIFEQPDELDDLLQCPLFPEMGMDPVLLDAANEAWHKNLHRILRKAGKTAAVHLPFFDLQPGSVDNFIREATIKRLSKGVERAQIYNPAHMIGHIFYDGNLYGKNYPKWRDRAAKSWAEALKSCPGHSPLFLENVYEKDPRKVLGMAEALREALEQDNNYAESGQIGICFDVGHWYSFGDGYLKNNLDEWLDILAPCLRHLHLHDNDGSFDQHLGLGKGKIDLDYLFKRLESLGLNVGITIEPHRRSDRQASLDFLAAKGMLSL